MQVINDYKKQFSNQFLTWGDGKTLLLDAITWMKSPADTHKVEADFCHVFIVLQHLITKPSVSP
jgi:hypothetical protein